MIWKQYYQDDDKLIAGLFTVKIVTTFIMI